MPIYDEKWCEDARRAIEELERIPRRPPDHDEEIRNQDSLGKWLGIDKGRMSNLVTGGKNTPREPIVVKMCAFLRISLPPRLQEKQEHRILLQYWRVWCLNPKEANDFLGDMRKRADELEDEARKKEASRVVPGSKKGARGT